MARVKILQRNVHPHPQTNALQALTLSAHYADGVEAEATILLRPGAVPNDDKSIRTVIENLAKALIEAARASDGVEG
jgi:hypothetical protein